MSSDFSRQRFDPTKDFSGVLMQQGRVQLDSDWNEWSEIIGRRWRSETIDIIGRGVVPRQTPEGFAISLNNGELAIGRGRIYVDGLAAENHGSGPQLFDAILGESSGSEPTGYFEQPYFPNPTPLPAAGGPHLVYLDVWEREVTSIEDPGLIESAVGVDTTTRSQIVWQVRVLHDAGTGTSCTTPDDQIPGWLDIVRPSAGRLSTAAIGVATTDDPCLVPPAGGYRGLENRLYRIEIHHPGPAGTATFKWSRDNASVATSVSRIEGGNLLTLDRVAWDAVRRFGAGDWCEITDDWREFSGLPGEVRRIASVDDARRIVTLEAPLTSGLFPVDGQNRTAPERHTRIKRWDQAGLVRDSSGGTFADLDAPGGSGLIPVPPPATSLILEDGVQVTFSVEPAGSAFRAGDFWVVAARTVDASVELLDRAPPRGPHHHFCRLGFLSLPAGVSDCRNFWPPESVGDCCDCSVCVTPESHNSGAYTIQKAFEEVRSTGGTVCLGPGVFELREKALELTGARSVKIRGHGWKTILLRQRGSGAIEVRDALGLVLENFSVVTPVSPGEAVPTIAVRSSAGITVSNCLVYQTGHEIGACAALGLSGLLYGTLIEGNVFVAAAGISQISAGDAQSEPLWTAGLAVAGNSFLCDRQGIDFGVTAIHQFSTQISENFLLGCEDSGIRALGAVTVGGGLSIRANEFRVRGNAIVAGCDGALISENSIAVSDKSADGIVIAAGADLAGPDRCQILANRVTGVQGAGIALRTRVRSAMIKQNILSSTGAGIVMEGDARAASLVIENNQLTDIAPRTTGGAMTGIRVLGATRADVSGNNIIGLGAGATQSAARLGIQVVAALSVRLTGNQLADLGPERAPGETVGIDWSGTFENGDISGNFHRRSQDPNEASADALVISLRVRTRADKPISAGTGTLTATSGNRYFALLVRRLIVLRRGRESLGIRGNAFESYGTAPTVLVDEAGQTVFEGNRCLLAFSRVSPVALLTARSIVAGNNCLDGPREFATLLIAAPPTAFTVLGNIVSSRIQVNGAPLAAPWSALNAKL